MRLEAGRFVSEAFSHFRARRPVQEQVLEAETQQVTELPERHHFWDDISTPRAAEIFLGCLALASTIGGTKAAAIRGNAEVAVGYVVDSAILVSVAACIYVMEKLANRVRSRRNKTRP